MTKSRLFLVVIGVAVVGGSTSRLQGSNLPDGSGQTGVLREQPGHLAPVADALGGTGVTIREPDDMDQMQEAIVKRDRPLLFDVKLSPEVTALLRS